MMCRFTGAVAAALLVLLVPSGAQAQLLVSGNDGKAVLVDGVNQVPNNPSADYVAVIDLGAKPPKVVAEILAPVSVVGPPQSVAVAADESFALVASAAKLDPKDAKKLVPDNTVTVIDLKASPPTAIGTVQAGNGAAGIAINRAGTLALVANRGEGTVSVFTVADKKLTPAGKIDFGNRSGPSSVAFTPDGKRALVTRDGDYRISVLSVDGGKVGNTKRDMIAGIRPYSMEIAPNGAFAIVGNIGLSQGDADTISLIDLKVEPPRVADTVTVGQTPESISISPDGRFAVAIVVNGSNKSKTSPFFNDFGMAKVFAIKGTKLTPVTEAKTGHWCQGSAWSKNSRTLVVQCMVENELQLFNFNGRTLTRSGGIKMSSSPASIGVAGR
jgi:DNA-binding beta-propeller fold protein YncE